MKVVILLSLFIVSFNSYAGKICYFSLNNVKEFEEMDKFTKKLNKYAKVPIEVQEFVTKGDNAEAAFQKMVDSGVECDGIVISGHHTGSFGGANASSSLSVDFLEKISCNPKNSKFFGNIKALWLQGCRTLGVGKIEANDTADEHTQRVGAVLDEDNLTQSFAQLNMEFSATLDQDNPLSSRYLRIFPRATTFGWTKTAPGVNARSELSIPYHIAHIAKLNDDRGEYFANPEKDIDEKSALNYLKAINQLLGKSLSNPKVCDDTRDEDKLSKAWIDHGTPESGNKYYFDNPDLNSFTSLLKGNSNVLNEARKFDCLLKNAKSKDDYLKVIDDILKNESVIGYTFNSIFELVQRLEKEGNIAGLNELRKKTSRL